ncbi:MAG: S24 family peptidase [Pseudomonadota bacterium]|nr:S24 family peptidase [Pseudomonadota bacterium]
MFEHAGMNTGYIPHMSTGIVPLPLRGNSRDKGPMRTNRELIVARISELVEKTGQSARAVSIKATGKPDTIRDILRGKSLPSAPTFARLAEALGTTTEYLAGASDAAEPVLSEVTINSIDDGHSRHIRQPNAPGIPLVGTGDCADIELTTEDGATIEVERSSFDPEYHVRYIQRPASLLGNPDVYAIYFHGSSMEPRFFAGEVGLIDPRRPAAPGDYVLVQISNGEGADVISVMAKRLVRQNSKEVILEQHNPPTTFTLPKKQVVRMHRIIPPTEQLFV